MKLLVNTIHFIALLNCKKGNFKFDHCFYKLLLETIQDFMILKFDEMKDDERSGQAAVAKPHKNKLLPFATGVQAGLALNLLFLS